MQNYLPYISLEHQANIFANFSDEDKDIFI